MGLLGIFRGSKKKGLLLFILAMSVFHWGALSSACESELESQKKNQSQLRVSLKLVELDVGSPTQLAVDIKNELEFVDQYRPGPSGYQLYAADRWEAIDRMRTLAEAGLIRVDRLAAYFQRADVKAAIDSKNSDESIKRIVNLEVVEKINDLRSFFQSVLDVYNGKQILLARDSQIVINSVRDLISQLEQKKSISYIWKLFTDKTVVFPWDKQTNSDQNYLDSIFRGIESMAFFNLTTTHKTSGAMHSLLAEWKTQLLLVQSEMNHQFRLFLSNTTQASDSLAFRNMVNVKNFLNHLINRVEYLLVEQDIRYLKAGIVALMELREYGLMVNHLKAIQDNYIYGFDEIPYLSDEEYSRQYLASFMDYWRFHRHSPEYTGQTPLMVTMSSAAMQRVLGGLAILRSKNTRLNSLAKIGPTQQTFLLIFKHENKDKPVYEIIRKRDVFTSGQKLIRVQELVDKKEKDGSTKTSVEVHVLDLREGVHSSKRLSVRELLASDLNHLTRPENGGIKSSDFDNLVVMMIGGIHQIPRGNTNSDN